MPTQARRTVRSRTTGDAVDTATAALEAAAQDVQDNAESPAAIGRATVDVGRQASSTTGRVVRAPASAVRTVVEDLAGAARRPDTVLAWVGLAGLAAFGVLEAPVAAAVGVGIAVAAGTRRARS